MPQESERRESELALDRIIEWRKQAEAHLTATDARINALENERNSALRWGIITLGAAVFGLIGLIWSFISGHIK